MYRPKSKILENQFTSGKEFVRKSTNKPYTGYYYALSNNKFYTGKSYDSVGTEELIPKQDVNITTKTSLGITVNSSPIPNPFYPTPTENDYKLGFITRYFLKKRNESYTTIREISGDDFNNFTDTESLYVTTKINWKITGDNIEETNRRLVSFKEGIMPGILLWFTDYKQFAK